MCKLTAGNGGHKMSWYSWSTIYFQKVSEASYMMEQGIKDSALRFWHKIFSGQLTFQQNWI